MKYTQSRSPKKVRAHRRERDAKTRRYSTMTPLLFNVMMLAVVALKVLAALVILNWIDGEPKKAEAAGTSSLETRM
jgi:hypothetical protein